MAQTTEDVFKLTDGTQLFRKTWHPSGTPIAKVIHLHGYSDHVDRYYSLFPTLAQHGIQTIGIDQRGWGRSAVKASEKGNTGPTAQILADVAELLTDNLPSAVPVFLHGHSMGGAEALTLASTPQYEPLTSQLAGIMLESPYIGLPPSQAPSALTLFAGRLAGRVVPHMQIKKVVDVKDIVRDPVVQKSLAEDVLCHNMGTLEMFSNMLDRCDRLASGQLTLNKGIKAIYLAHGDGDMTVSYDASKKWFAAQAGVVPDRTFKDYPGWSHQLHADSPENGQQYANDVAQWILQRVERSGQDNKQEQAKL